MITANAPNSPILQQNQDVKTAQANLAAASAKLDTQDGQVGAIENELTTARATLANTTVDWDSFYDVFVSVARLYCKTAEDAAGRSACPRPRTRWPSGSPPIRKRFAARSCW